MAKKGKPAVAAADQRHFNTKASITYTAKVDNGWQESVRKLTQAHDVLTKMVNTTLHKELLQLSKMLARWMTICTALRGEEEEASQDMQGICSDNCCDSFTILDNFLTVGEWVGG
jgi:hypothetical protein